MKVFLTILAFALILFGGGCTVLFIAFVNPEVIFSNLRKDNFAAPMLSFWVFGGLLPIIIGVTIMWWQMKQGAKSRLDDGDVESRTPGESPKNKDNE